MRRVDLVFELADRICRVGRPHPVRVAIDGVDAAGKTTLADELVLPVERLGRSVIRASIDGFHNPAAVRHQRGDTSPAGYYRDSFNHAGLIQTLLAPLGPGGDRRYRRAIFDFRLDSPVDAPLEEAIQSAVLLFDGVFLLSPALQPYWDFSIFVKADFEVTTARAECRDSQLFGTSSRARQRYNDRYVPGQRLYLAEAQPEGRACVVVDNNDPLEPILEWPVQLGGRQVALEAARRSTWPQRPPGSE
jgi:uridine kinase